MKHNVIAAAVLGLCLIIAAFLYTGRYYLLRLSDERMARIDRWTGSVRVYDCSPDWWISMGRCDDTPAPAGNKAMNVDENLTTEDMNSVDMSGVGENSD